MGMLNIPLSETLAAFIDQRVADSDFETSGDYVTDLIQRKLDRERLRQMVLKGANSPMACVADDAYFEDLKAQIRARAAG